MTPKLDFVFYLTEWIKWDLLDKKLRRNIMGEV